jgi:hypothetical protein
MMRKALSLAITLIAAASMPSAFGFVTPARISSTHNVKSNANPKMEFTHLKMSDDVSFYTIFYIVVCRYAI